MKLHQIKAIIVAALVVITTPFVALKSWEHIDAHEIMVIQSPIGGKLTWFTTAGTHWQGFGTVTKYPKRMQYWFSSKSDQGSTSDESVKIRFNDGAHATISGSLSWEMPLDDVHLTLAHTKYGSAKALEQQLIRTNLEKSLYMTGPLMSSAESYAARRNDLLGLIDDQFMNGVFRTSSRDERTDDPITGQKKTVKIVEPIKGDDGKFVREEESPLIALGIKAFNLSINDIKYDGAVETQIQKQQESIMAVQTAIAKTKMAEQDALTFEAQGKAEAAQAEWKQKVEMATATTKAKQEKEVALTAASKELEVAELQTKATEQKKLQEILLGEGEAMRRQLVMNADGALEKKLTAWVAVNSKYAEAIGRYTGAWVPSVVMGGTSGNTGNEQATNGSGANDLINLLTVKTAKDLQLSMELPTKAGNIHNTTVPASEQR